MIKYTPPRDHPLAEHYPNGIIGELVSTDGDMAQIRVKLRGHTGMNPSVAVLVVSKDRVEEI